MRNLYDELPLETLVQFFYYINKNIEKKILSDAMYSEIELIKEAIKKRGHSMDDLNKMSFFMHSNDRCSKRE